MKDEEATRAEAGSRAGAIAAVRAEMGVEEGGWGAVCSVVAAWVAVAQVAVAVVVVVKEVGEPEEARWAADLEATAGARQVALVVGGSEAMVWEVAASVVAAPAVEAWVVGCLAALVTVSAAEVMATLAAVEPEAEPAGAAAPVVAGSGLEEVAGATLREAGMRMVVVRPAEGAAVAATVTGLRVAVGSAAGLQGAVLPVAAD